MTLDQGSTGTLGSDHVGLAAAIRWRFTLLDLPVPFIRGLIRRIWRIGLVGEQIVKAFEPLLIIRHCFARFHLFRNCLRWKRIRRGRAKNHKIDAYRGKEARLCNDMTCRSHMFLVPLCSQKVPGP